MDAPSHWVAVDAAFSGPSGVCRMAGTAPVGCEIIRGLEDVHAWMLALRGMPEKDKAGTAHPELVVVEYPFLSGQARQNVDSAIKLGQAVGWVRALAGLLGARVELRRASQWRKHLGISGGLPEAKAKATCRAIVRGLATHPDQRAPVRGRFNRVWLPGLEGVGESAKDHDRAEAAGMALAFCIEKGWPLPSVECA